MRGVNPAALAGTDFEALVERVSFAAGESRKTVDVAINDNSSSSGPKTFDAVIRYPENAEIGALDETLVTITDDDVSQDDGSGGGALDSSLFWVLSALGLLRRRRILSAMLPA